MPKKIQIKLLSDSGELLNIVTCRAGRIAVLRGSSSSDLRPYQRALSSTDDTENLQVTCDGVPYNNEGHSLLGFGEVSPCAGLSVKAFLVKHGVPDDSQLSLLMSFGLTECHDKECSQLSADEERRLRLAAFTAHPSKALILNNPFESISGSWRDSVAELLASHAKNNGALVIVTSLTYRPEAWIDNDIVDRIQVGQTAQRTIGFGSSDMANTSLMAEITSRVRQDNAPQSPSVQQGPQKTASLASAALGVVGEMDTEDVITSGHTKTTSIPFVAKALSVILGIGLGTWGAFTLMSPAPESASTTVESATQATENRTAALPQSNPVVAENKKALANASPQEVSAPQSKKSHAKVMNRPSKQYLLDLYPLAIKNSIIKTANGVIPPIENNQPDEGASNQAKSKKNTGSLFSLLQNASSNEKSESPQEFGYDRHPARPYQPFSESREADSEDQDAMEARREEIRNRFLEAIRQSALRRQAQLEEELDY